MDSSNFYSDSLIALMQEYEKTRDLHLNILSWLNNNLDTLMQENLMEILNFSLETSKQLQTTLALMDKIIRVKNDKKDK